LQLLYIFPEGFLRIVCKWKMNKPTKESQEIYGIYENFSSQLNGHLNGTFILRERAFGPPGVRASRPSLSIGFLPASLVAQVLSLPSLQLPPEGISATNGHLCFAARPNRGRRLRLKEILFECYFNHFLRRSISSSSVLTNSSKNFLKFLFFSICGE
jgi:hypothetical protein